MRPCLQQISDIQHKERGGEGRGEVQTGKQEAQKNTEVTAGVMTVESFPTMSECAIMTKGLFLF